MHNLKLALLEHPHWWNYIFLVYSNSKSYFNFIYFNTTLNNIPSINGSIFFTTSFKYYLFILLFSLCLFLFVNKQQTHTTAGHIHHHCHPHPHKSQPIATATTITTSQNQTTHHNKISPFKPKPKSPISNKINNNQTNITWLAIHYIHSNQWQDQPPQANQWSKHCQSQNPHHTINTTRPHKPTSPLKPPIQTT